MVSFHICLCCPCLFSPGVPACLALPGLKLVSSPVHVTCAGFFALVLSCAVTVAAAYQGVDFTYIHSHFLQLAVASFIVSTLLSVYLYVRSLSAAPADLALGGSSGKTWLDALKPLNSLTANEPCFAPLIHSWWLISLLSSQVMWCMTFSKDGSSIPD